MNREIKFRGKRIDNGEWVYGNLFFTTGDTISQQKLSNCIQVVNDTEYLTYEVIPSSVGQYTGIKNKDGIDIYEGDILQIKLVYYDKYKMTGYYRVNIDKVTGVYFRIVNIAKDSEQQETIDMQIDGKDLRLNENNIVKIISRYTYEQINLDSNYVKYTDETNEVKVIGNIHNNPELLQEVQK